MPEFQITGIITYVPRKFCECDHCNGHHGKTRTQEIDITFEAGDKQKALEAADAEVLEAYDGYSWYCYIDKLGRHPFRWVAGPFFGPLPEEFHMRKVGAPTLFELA